MKLIFGLGNPGGRYSLSRHNAGFLVIDAFSERFGLPLSQSKCNALIGKGRISGVSVLLAEPQTFMNLSGEAVGRLVRFLKADETDVIVVHDDLDFPFGTVRVKRGGGNGGHKGLRSISAHLGGSDFVRVRVGIGRPCRSELVESYVLERFSDDELKELPNIIETACDVLVEILGSGAESAMASVNSRK